MRRERRKLRQAQNEESGARNAHLQYAPRAIAAVEARNAARSAIPQISERLADFFHLRGSALLVSPPTSHVHLLNAGSMESIPGFHWTRCIVHGALQVASRASSPLLRGADLAPSRLLEALSFKAL